MTSKLAIHGGARSLRGNLEMRRIQVQRGLSRSYDLLKMLPLTLRGWTSVNEGGIVERFERAFAEATGARYALAMNSGTASLHSAYFALGVGPGTEVIVPSYTWHATATPILQCGAVPVFCEIDPQTLTADPHDIQRRITERTRVISVLHAWGNPAPMDRILEIAGRHGLFVVEDCSHAHGAVYKGKPVGTWGHIGCFSCQGSKAVDGGEAGVAITDESAFLDRMLLLGHNYLVRNVKAFDFGDISLGVKYRPHPAAMYLACASLQRLPNRNRRAARAWQWLCEELEGVAGIRPIATLPGSQRGGYYAFVFDYRGEELGGPGTEEFVEAVRAEGAPLDFDQFRGRLLHTLPFFTEFDRTSLGGGCYDPTRPREENLWKGALPETERVTARLVRFPSLLYAAREGYVRRCARAVKKVLGAQLSSKAPDAERSMTAIPREVPPIAQTGG